MLTRAFSFFFLNVNYLVTVYSFFSTFFLETPGPLQHVVSVVKGKTNLPCDITPPVEDDQASLVLFYKDDASPSIYTWVPPDLFIPLLRQTVCVFWGKILIS